MDLTIARDALQLLGMFLLIWGVIYVLHKKYGIYYKWWYGIPIGFCIGFFYTLALNLIGW